MKPFGPPAYYLDFETISPAIPVYPGTSPFQVVPFQWSLHHLDKDGNLTHSDYLADGQADPRPALAKALIKAVGRTNEPIISYTSYEGAVLGNLSRDFPDLAKPLSKIIGRLQDLHRLVKDHLYQPAFGGSFSIKAVGPALVPDLGYDQLEGVADGLAASAAFYALTTDQLGPDQDPTAVRDDLLAYCHTDSLAMVRVHQALLDLAGA